MKANMGDGMASSTTFGPVQNQMQYNKVKALIAEAIAQGAKALSGQQQLPEQGYFIAPTILTEVSDSCRVVQEEQLRPVLPVLKYTDINAAIAPASDREIGFVGFIWSSHLKAAQTHATQLLYGTVGRRGQRHRLPRAIYLRPLSR